MILFDNPRLLILALFGGLLLATEGGHQLGKRSRVNEDESYHEQIMGLRDSLFVLVSLLIGFTFSMALSRYDQRRQASIDEANAIGTTVLRARLLAEPESSRAVESLRQYTDARMDFFAADLASSRMEEVETRSKRIQNELWELTVSGAQRDRSPVFATFVQTLNEMIDLDAKRLAPRENRIPVVIWILIVMVAVFATFTTGLGLKRRLWVSSFMLPAILAVSISLVADLDMPTRGFIRIDRQTTLRLQQDLQK